RSMIALSASYRCPILCKSYPSRYAAMSLSFFNWLLCENSNRKATERDAHLMQHQCIHGLATLGRIYQHGIDTRDMGIRGIVKRAVRQVNGLVKKLFVVHRPSVASLHRHFHSYFPRCV